MEDYGWIQLHRKLLANPIFDNAELLRLFIYCLLKANHKENEIIWNGELTKIKKGEFVTGRKVIAKDLKQKETTIYKRLKNLEKLGYINIRSNNKFSLLQIVKYSTYQSQELPKGQQSNNGVTTKGQQSNTNNNDNNGNNEEKTFLTTDTKEVLFQSIFNKFPQDIKMGEDVCRHYFLADVETKEDFDILESSYIAMEKTTSKDFIPKPANFFRDWRKYKPSPDNTKTGYFNLNQ